jgi:hypothetical protein
MRKNNAATTASKLTAPNDLHFIKIDSLVRIEKFFVPSPRTPVLHFGDHANGATPYYTDLTHHLKAILLKSRLTLQKYFCIIRRTLFHPHTDSHLTTPGNGRMNDMDQHG